MNQLVKKTYSCFSKKLCNLQYTITNHFWKATMYFLYTNWFISLFCANIKI